MTLLQLAEKRYSVKSFTDQPVEAENSACWKACTNRKKQPATEDLHYSK